MRNVLDGGRPGDERGFIHKKILGFVSKAASFLPIPGVIGDVAGALSGGGGFAPRQSICPPGTPGCPGGGGGGVVPGDFTGAQPCPRGTVPDPLGRDFCVSPKSGIGQRTGAAFPDEFGDAVTGRFGAGLQPLQFDVLTRRCPRGAVLAVDGLCYNRRDIRNSERMWPKGRAPLLTGGEMRCISIASRAAKKLETKEKQLRKMGMLKALPRRGGRKQLTAGHHEHLHHD